MYIISIPMFCVQKLDIKSYIVSCPVQGTNVGILLVFPRFMGKNWTPIGVMASLRHTPHEWYNLSKVIFCGTLNTIPFNRCFLSCTSDILICPQKIV